MCKLVLYFPLALGGCGGAYTLTAGDHLAVAGQEAPVVVRLQRNDFFVLDLAVKNALMRFRAPDGRQRAAYTDKQGYAATTVPAPPKPGRYVLRVDHTDLEGQEVSAAAALFVWDGGRPGIAVAADDLPWGRSRQADAARAALHKLAERANLAYMTRRPLREHVVMRLKLMVEGYPDGPILLWQRQRWHVVRQGRFRAPRVVVESRLVSQLSELRKMFPGLSVGICASRIAAKAFASAGMRPIVIGPAAAAPAGATGRTSWSDLAEKGI